MEYICILAYFGSIISIFVCYDVYKIQTGEKSWWSMDKWEGKGCSVNDITFKQRYSEV
jgi:hypothetical protein